MFPKNAAKLHFLFHSTKYLSRNSQYFPFFFQFVNSASHFQLLFHKDDAILWLGIALGQTAATEGLEEVH